jgi:hypothetical protein
VHGTKIEKEVEIYATNLANKTKCMSLFPVSETLCFLVSRIQDNGQSPKTQ